MNAHANDLLFIQSQQASDRLYEARCSFYDWCLSFASSGIHAHNPYHDVAHCVFVYNVGVCAIKHETGDGCSPEFMLAALMHDYDHSGGRMSDEWNIGVAIEGVRRALQHPRCVMLDSEKVENLIEVTQFDGREKGFKYMPGMLEAQAIRDADLMTVYATDAPDRLHRLYIECCLSNPKLTLDDFMRGNRAFLTEAKMYTDYGMYVKERYLESSLEAVESAMFNAFPKLCQPTYA